VCVCVCVCCVCVCVWRGCTLFRHCISYLFFTGALITAQHRKKDWPALIMRDLFWALFRHKDHAVTHRVDCEQKTNLALYWGYVLRLWTRVFELVYTSLTRLTLHESSNTEYKAFANYSNSNIFNIISMTTCWKSYAGELRGPPNGCSGWTWGEALCVRREVEVP
jgi:hypothetical protein